MRESNDLPDAEAVTHRRELPPISAFANDDGSADSHLAALLGQWRAGKATKADVVTALRGQRVLVPIVARARGEGTTVVGVTAPDGRVAMPLFTSVAELDAWHPGARPMPVLVEQAALAAIDENWHIMVLDPASSAFLLGRPAVFALMSGQPWRPAVVDNMVSAEVRAALVAALTGQDVRSIHAAPGRTSEVMVIVEVDPQVDRARVGAGVQAALAGSPALVELVDSFEVRFMKWDSPAGGSGREAGA